MLMDVIFGAISGCLTCCFLFHYMGILNYDLIMKLIEGYAKMEDSCSNAETSWDSKVQAEPLRSGGNVLNNLYNRKGLENKSQRSLRKGISRESHQLEAREKNDGFPFDSPVMGARKPLWSHRYTASLEAAASKLYQAWREGEADGWTLSTNHKSGLQIFRKKRASGLDIIKGVFRIPYPVEMIITEVRDVESVLKFDIATSKHCKKLETYGQGGGVQYTLFKSPSRLISTRDVVFAYDCCLIKGKNIVLSPAVSVVFDSCPKNPGKVRAELHFGGWVFEVNSPDSTKATYIIATDLKGSIPAWIVNQTSEDLGRTPLNVSKFMEEKYGTHIATHIPSQCKKSKAQHVAQKKGNYDGLRKIKRKSRKLEAKEMSDGFPFDSPVLGEKEPLWNHMYTAQLETTASKIYQAWREGEVDGWTLSTSHKSGLQIFRKKRAVGIDIIKSVFTIPYPIGMIIKEVHDVESVFKFDNAIVKDCKKLATYRQGGGVQYSLFKSPSRLVSTRDMVFAYDCCRVKGKNVILSPAVSVIFDLCPEKAGNVRCDLQFGGWVFEVKSPGCTIATYIVANDLKGSIPNWIVNQTTEDVGRTPLNVSKFMEEKYGTYIPLQHTKSKVKQLAAIQGDDDGLLYASEDDIDDSIEDESEDSLEPIADQTGTETQISTAVIRIGNGRLTTHQQATILTKLNVTIADVEKFTDDSSKKLWTRVRSRDKKIKMYRRKDGKSGYMGKSVLKFEAQKIFEALKEPSFRKHFDPMLKSLQVVEQIGDLYVVHMHHQTKRCIAKIRRDMLVAWGSRKIGQKYVIAGTSITHPACPVDTTMKRINVDVSGWVVEEYRKRPGYSLVCFVFANIDYGQLPESIVRYVNKKQLMAIYDLALAIKSRDENVI